MYFNNIIKNNLMEEQIQKMVTDIQQIKNVLLGISLFDPAKQFLPKFEPSSEDLNVQKILDRIHKGFQAFSNIHSDSIKELVSKTSIQERVNENNQVKFKFIESKIVAITEEVFNILIIVKLTGHANKIDIQQLKEELYYYKGQNQQFQQTLATKEVAQELQDRVTRLDRLIINKMDKSESNELLKKSLLALQTQFQTQISDNQINYTGMMKKLENTENMIRRNNDKFEIYKENIQSLIEKVKDQKTNMTDVLQKKVNLEQFQELKLQCEKFASKLDVTDLQIKIDPMFDQIIKEFSSFKVQYEQYTKLISQLDYSILLKANKMDIQLVENHMQQLSDLLKNKQEQIDGIMKEFKRQEFSLQNKLQEATENLQEFVGKLILEEESKAINERIGKILESHNIKEMIKNQYKIQFMLDKKADQSQIIEINQNKASQKHLDKLEIEYFNLIKTIKITLLSIGQFMEVFQNKHDTTESLNHQKSEIQKSLSLIYSLQQQLAGISTMQQQVLSKNQFKNQQFPDDQFQSKKRSKTSVSNYDDEKRQRVNIVSYKMMKYSQKYQSVGKQLDFRENQDYSVKLNPVLYQTQVLQKNVFRQKRSQQNL